MVKKEINAGVLLSNIRSDTDITGNEKLLLSEIVGLAAKRGYCWATNRYFAAEYNVSARTIINWINHLVEIGYLNRDYDPKNAHLGRRLSLGDKAYEMAVVKNASQGREDNFMGNMKEVTEDSEADVTQNIRNNIRIIKENNITCITDRQQITKNEREELLKQFA